jgi:hypothetical protein
MMQRSAGQVQLKLSWNLENVLWLGMPEAKRSACQGLLAQLLQSVATAQDPERSESDEREDLKPAS